MTFGWLTATKKHEDTKPWLTGAYLEEVSSSEMILNDRVWKHLRRKVIKPSKSKRISEQRQWSSSFVTVKSLHFHQIKTLPKHTPWPGHWHQRPSRSGQEDSGGQRDHTKAQAQVSGIQWACLRTRRRDCFKGAVIPHDYAVKACHWDHMKLWELSLDIHIIRNTSRGGG